MHCTTFPFIFLLLFVWHALGVPGNRPAQVVGGLGQMARWTAAGIQAQVPEEALRNPITAPDRDELPWMTQPTWYAQYPASNVQKFLDSDPGSHDSCVELAEHHFVWLKNPNNRETHDGHSLSPWDRKSGLMTIAVMYDPVHKWYFASTVPRSPLISVMRTSATTDGYAPYWWKAFTKRGKSIPIPHAEDGAYYIWETSDKVKIVYDDYPQGTVIRTVTGNEKSNPQKIPTCSKRNAMSGSDPASCEEVAEELGVEHLRAQTRRQTDRLTRLARDLSIRDDTSAEKYSDAQIRKWISIFAQQRLALAGKTCPAGKPQGTNSGSKGTLHQRAAKVCNAKPPFPVQTFSFTSGKASKTTSSNSKATKTTDKSASTKKVSAGKSSTQKAQATPTCSYVPKGKSKPAHCVCNKSNTLPLLTIKPSTKSSLSCRYTTLPTRHRARDEFVPASSTEPIVTATVGPEEQVLTFTTTW